MDKLKENAFAVSLGAIGVLLLVLAYFLVYRPINDLSAQGRSVDSALSKLRQVDAREETPSEDLVRAKRRQRQEAADALENGRKYFDKRVVPFQKYFGDADAPLDMGSFYSQYEDGINQFVAQYRQKHGISAEEDTSGGSGSGRKAPRPRLQERIRSEADPMTAEAAIPLAMKEFWIIESVFAACEKLDLGGLEEINLPTRVERESRRTATETETEGEEEAPEEYFEFEHLDATVVIRLRFGDIQKFLVELLSSERVPYVDIVGLEIRKVEDDVKAREEFVRGFLKKDSVANAEPAEPDVLVTVVLRALDWKGEKKPAEDSLAPEEDI